MKRFNKVICLFAALVLFLSCVTSCDNEEDKPINDKTDAKLIYNKALTRINNASSYVREESYRTELTQDGQTIIGDDSIVSKYSFDGVGEDSFSYTFKTADYGAFTLSFCEDVGYVETESNAFSFDCTLEEFVFVAQHYMYVAGFVTNINVFSMFNYDATCEKNEQGYYFISISRLVHDENTKEMLLGSGYERYTDVSGVNLSATIVISPSMFFEEILTDITFSANTETGRADFTIHNRVAFSEIDSKTVYVDIPTYNCEHIGNSSVFEGLDVFINLNRLPGYTASLVGEYSLSGETLQHNDSITTDFVIKNDENQNFALKSLYNCDGVQRSYQMYYTDGVLYSKYDDVLNFTDYGEEAGRYYSLDLWTDPFFAINAGKSFSLTNNDNDIATLNYEFDERLVELIISNYFHTFYDVNDIPEIGDVLSIEKAVASVTYDAKKLVVIEQTYEIEATVEIDGESYVYKETRRITVNTDNYTVPEKEVFLGTSEL